VRSGAKHGMSNPVMLNKRRVSNHADRGRS
jgi:hypothetical protein